MIDRERHVLAGSLGPRGDDVDRAAERVLDDRLEAGLARERLVERALEPVEAVVVRPGEPEHVRGDGTLRIRAQLLRVEPEPRNLALVQSRGLGGIGLAGDVDEALAPVLQHRIELVGVEPEGLPGEDCGALGIDDVPRIGIDRRRLLADRERLAGAVVDRAPSGRDLDRLAVLGDRHRREPIVLRGLEPRRAGQRNDEDERKSRQQQANPVIRLPAARLAFHLPSRTYVVVNPSAAWRPSFDFAASSIRTLADALESCERRSALSAFS